MCVHLWAPFLSHYNLKATFWKEGNPLGAWKHLSINRNLKCTWGQNLMSVRMTDVGCLAPNSGGLGLAEGGYQRKVYSNGYKKISFAIWQPPATMPSTEQTPFSSTSRKSIQFQPGPGRQVLFANCKLKDESVHQYMDKIKDPLTWTFLMN